MRLDGVEPAQGVALGHAEIVGVVGGEADGVAGADAGVARLVFLGDHAGRPADHERPPGLLLVLGRRRRDAHPLLDVRARVDGVRRRALRLHLIVGVRYDSMPCKQPQREGGALAQEQDLVRLVGVGDLLVLDALHGVHDHRLEPLLAFRARRRAVQHADDGLLLVDVVCVVRRVLLKVQERRDRRRRGAGSGSCGPCPSPYLAKNLSSTLSSSTGLKTARAWSKMTRRYAASRRRARPRCRLGPEGVQDVRDRLLTTGCRGPGWPT